MSNDNPIKEVKPFRFGIDNNELNSNYSEDLHDCSTDLSNEGSIREEREHAEFARRKKQAMLNKTNYNNQNKSEYISKKSQIIKFGIIGVFFIIYIISLIFSEMTSFIDEFFSDMNNYSEIDYQEYEQEVESKKQLFAELKNGIIINSSVISNGRIVLEVVNKNIETFNNIRVQTIFYDYNNLPIYISENNIDTLFSLQSHFCEIIDAPESYSRFEFLITQPYVADTENVEYSDLSISTVENLDGDFEISLSNNSLKNIDAVEVVILYYKENNIVEIDRSNFYEVRSGETQTDTKYNFINKNTYDEVSFIINDISIY